MALLGFAGIGIAVIASVIATWYLLIWIRLRRIKPKPQFLVRDGAFCELARRVLGEPPMIAGPADHGTRGGEQGIIPPPVLEPGKGLASARMGSAAMWMAAGADGITPGLEVWLRWSSVDEHVFQAASHMSHEQIDGFADLLKMVNAKGYAIETAGFFNKLLGHVGEWHVQEHLAAAGHAVAMPSVTNEPSVDLWVDGHGMNVKTVADVATAAHEHFADHPDVPIIVPADAANIPEDALYFDPAHGLDVAALAVSDHAVIVDSALSHADVAQQAHDAIDLLQDPGPHAHVPWVTFAISAFREGRLLVRGNTDLGRAVKNVVVDTASVGGGAFVGMKIGAVAGTAFGPVGTVIGGVVGGIGGALLGRKTANAIKRIPLEEAQKAYNAALLQYRQAEQEAARFAETAWATSLTREQDMLNQELASIRSAHDKMVEHLRERVAKAAFLGRDEAERVLRDAESRVLAVVSAATERLRCKAPGFRSWIAGFVAPREYAEKRALERDATRWRQQARQLLRAWPGDEEGTSRVYDLVMAAPGGQHDALAYLENVARQRHRTCLALRSTMETALAEAAKARAKAVARLRDAWSGIEEEVRERLLPAVSSPQTSADCFRSELRKAGVEV